MLVMTKPALWYVSDAIVSEYAMVLARPEPEIRRNLRHQLLQLIMNHTRVRNMSDTVSRWNWQPPDSPKLKWQEPRLAQAEQHFLLGAGTLVGTVKHLNGDEREQIIIEAISSEAVTTSEIEGEILDRASVQSSIRR